MKIRDPHPERWIDAAPSGFGSLLTTTSFKDLEAEGWMPTIIVVLRTPKEELMRSLGWIFHVFGRN